MFQSARRSMRGGRVKNGLVQHTVLLPQNTHPIASDPLRPNRPHARGVLCVQHPRQLQIRLDRLSRVAVRQFLQTPPHDDKVARRAFKVDAVAASHVAGAAVAAEGASASVTISDPGARRWAGAEIIVSARRARATAGALVCARDVRRVLRPASSLVSSAC